MFAGTSSDTQSFDPRMPKSIRVKRGDYVRQLRGPTSWSPFHLPSYFLSPAHHGPPVCHGTRIGTVYGPVHDTLCTWNDESKGWMSVLVPSCKNPYFWDAETMLDMERHPRKTFPDLVWINIGKNPCVPHPVGGNPVWCCKVSDDEVASWREAGWQEVWMD